MDREAGSTDTFALPPVPDTPGYVSPNREESLSGKTNQQAQQHSLLSVIIALGFTVAAGFSMATTSYLATELTLYVGHAIRSSFITVLGGGIVFWFAVLVRRDWSALNWDAIKNEMPWWHFCLPGVIHACGMVVMVMLVPIITAGTFIVSAIVGQLTTSVAFDHFAIWGTALEKFTIFKLLLIVLVLSGVIMAQGFNQSASSWWLTILYMLIAAGNGCPVVPQAILNKLQTARLGSPFNTSLVSYSLSSLILLVASAVTFFWALEPDEPMSECPWWAWLSGCSSAGFVLSGCVAPKYLGAGLFFVALVSGQLLAPVVYDLTGLFTRGAGKVTWIRVFGVVLVFVGVLGLHLYRTYWGAGRRLVTVQDTGEEVEVHTIRSPPVGSVDELAR